MPQAIIFDVDGTLVDTVDFHARAWQEAFREYGKEFPFEKVRGQIGKGGDQLLPVFLSEAEIEKFGEPLKKFRDGYFQEHFLPRVKPFPQVRELFRRILADGLRIGLASSGKDEEVENYKKIADVADLLEMHTSSDDAEKSKPEPDIFLAAMHKMDGISGENAIVVGDTPYDAEAAGKAGIKTVGVLCGGFPEADLRKAGCIAVYRDPAHLLAEFDKSPLK